MEHIGEVLKRTGINTSRANMDTPSAAEAAPSENSICPICKGAGIVHPLLDSGKPDFSRVVACRCVQQAEVGGRQNRLQRYSRLGQLSRLTFDNLLPQGRSGNPADQEHFRRACDAARAFAENPTGWFVLSGSSGSGKTHLAAAIANERLSRGHLVFYITTPDLLDHLRSTYSPGGDMPYGEFFSQVRNAPMLVLDDLGVQAGTPWAKEKLDQLLTYRFNDELPTVIVTTLPVEQLDDRLHTRLNDSRLCQLHVLEEKSALADFSSGMELELLKSMIFDNFDHKRVNLPLAERENLEHAFREALSFAQSPDGWLVLLGVTGCGKTHLAAAIANYRRQAGEPVLFLVVPEFLDHLRSTFNLESKVSYDHLFENAKNAPLLILDDFGEQAATPWAQEKLYQVINYRYNARLAMVITSRFSPEEIDSRIYSRLADPKISLVWNITAPDFRTDVSQRKSSRRSGSKR